MRIILLSLIALIIALPACNNVDFNPEPEDPRLPIYSEEGFNMAGCYINDKPWISQRETTSYATADLYNIGDGFVLRFDSHESNSHFDLNNDIQFTIKDPDIAGENDLATYLRGKTYDLGTTENHAGLEISAAVPNTIEGTLNFSANTSGLIIAGTFYFINQEPTGETTRYTSGRLDYESY